jgi:uncharacterized protein YcaQ
LLWRERWLFEYWAHAASIVLTEEELPQAEVVLRADRRRGALVVEGVFAEEEFAGAGAPLDPPVTTAIESLASFVGAGSISYSGDVALGVS